LEKEKYTESGVDENLKLSKGEEKILGRERGKKKGRKREEAKHTSRQRRKGGGERREGKKTDIEIVGYHRIVKNSYDKKV